MTRTDIVNTEGANIVYDYVSDSPLLLTIVGGDATLPPLRAHLMTENGQVACILGPRCPMVLGGSTDTHWTLYGA